MAKDQLVSNQGWSQRQPSTQAVEACRFSKSPFLCISCVYSSLIKMCAQKKKCVDSF